MQETCGFYPSTVLAKFSGNAEIIRSVFEM
jgi:hypothetical protein